MLEDVPALRKRLTNERRFLAADIEVTEEVPERQTTDRYLCWKLRVPYKDKMLLVVLNFPKFYPFQSPDIKIPEPAGILDGICCCHARDGTLCVSGFLNAWAPTWTVARLLDRIKDLLDRRIKADQTRLLIGTFR